ncbi:ABC transporter ATP-binding protein [Mediterraneibacter sp. NSJ-55]|uniref:ABC transporter ATP-binding protein n=1 Tax=Mediterraneibacter hominis TaxID=2763054 RepID=A0A923LIX3_9FIRM|nr:ABC transporter ATP-binding protein [Mediterraneibacter hominis]MBC5689531.1 ABC transporter ATP-binding protein [Mediterraneibacter hominis]
MFSIIECRNITYYYPLSRFPALIDINIALEAGKIYGILGANGSGKTTFCSLLRGFVPAFYQGTLTGEVLLKNKPLSDYGGLLAKEIGYVFQNPFTQLSGVKDTVFEEVAYGLENIGADADTIEPRVIQAMEKTNIKDLALKNPLHLSGGQLQRTALASVLVQEPDILILDEPTSQLDPQETRNVFDIVKALKEQKKTVIIAEHKTDLIAEYADEVLIFEKGRLTNRGNINHILSSPDLIDRGVLPPQAALLSNKLKQYGISFDSIPITYDQALNVINRLLHTEKR